MQELWFKLLCGGGFTVDAFTLETPEKPYEFILYTKTGSLRKLDYQNFKAKISNLQRKPIKYIHADLINYNGEYIYYLQGGN